MDMPMSTIDPFDPTQTPHLAPPSPRPAAAGMPHSARGAGWVADPAAVALLVDFQDALAAAVVDSHAPWRKGAATVAAAVLGGPLRPPTPAVVVLVTPLADAPPPARLARRHRRRAQAPRTPTLSPDVVPMDLRSTTLGGGVYGRRCRRRPCRCLMVEAAPAEGSWD